MAAALAVTSAQAQPPPIKIECTFHRVGFPNKGGYSKTKVVPKDIAWLKPGANPYGSAGIGFVVLGRGIGHLTASTDLCTLCIQLAQVASDHGANAIKLSNIESRHAAERSISADRGHYFAKGKGRSPSPTL